MEIKELIITALTVLTSAGAWRYYELKVKMNRLIKKDEREDSNLYRDDLRERVVILEQRLTSELKRNNDLMVELSILKQVIAEYKVRLEFLEKST
jgi:hypothetical protein